MKLQVATLQPFNDNDGFESNLARAEVFLNRSVKDGAQLVLCPEFLATGYTFEPKLWEMAEGKSGPTVSWLKRKAKEHNIYIGASYLEVQGCDFVNTFVLVDNQGKELGRVYKDNLPFYENYFCKPVTGSHQIETEIGKIGIGICFENQRRFLYNEFAENRPDLILMPHSAPAPQWHRSLADAFTNGVTRIPQFFADTFEVPVVLSNKSGMVISKVPLLPGATLPLKYIGASAICLPAPQKSIQLGAEPGYLIHGVEIDRKIQRTRLSPIQRSFNLKVNLLTSFSIPVIATIEKTGRIVYETSKSRQMAAKSISMKLDLSKPQSVSSY